MILSRANFGEDLYYRLNVFPIEKPALRRKKRDIRCYYKELLFPFESDNAPLDLLENALTSPIEHNWARQCQGACLI